MLRKCPKPGGTEEAVLQARCVQFGGNCLNDLGRLGELYFDLLIPAEPPQDLA